MKSKLIICSNDEKIKLLKELNKNKEIKDIKFMTKEEYIKNYFFDYDNDTLYYLMNKYNYNLDVCKVYLKNMLVIDINKTYKNAKLEFLKELKKELIENNLLKFNKLFPAYLKDKEIVVSNYYTLDKYEELALGTKVYPNEVSLSTVVREFDDIEDEVNYVCLKIIDLIKKGVSINNIYLCNVGQEYYYIIDKLFSYYNIPININFNDSIYNTKTVQDYLLTRQLDLDDPNKTIINKKLANIINSLSTIDSTSPIYDKLLIDKLKHTTFNSKTYTPAVNIRDLSYPFSKDDYVFVLSFNQDILPKMSKDIDYITDSIKEEVDMYKTDYLNIRNKKTCIYLLSRIDNLYLSYKLNSPFSSYYKSSLIDDLNLKVIREDIDNYNYSDIYNKLRLAQMLDKYYLYGEVDNNLIMLNNHYNIDYNTYSNNYTGINTDLYLNKVNNPLTFSYTSLNSYIECSFKYYIKYILKLDEYTDSFESFLGSLYHYILSIYRRDDFDFEKEWNNYLLKRELSTKERLFLVKIKEDLISLIDTIKKQNLLTGFDGEVYEKKFEVTLNKKVPSKFIGYIDKIMYYKKNNKIYYSVIDYKTGNIDARIEPMKYGLHLQLPIYLYLIKNCFNNNYKFTGIYYQNIMFNYPTWSNKLEKEVKNRYKLNGYSTTDTSILEVFDVTYENSELIKGMRYSEKNGFYRWSKVLSSEEEEKLVDYVGKIVDEQTDNIINAKFDINPKVYDGNDVSCKFCNYKDLCFKRENDNIYLDKVANFDFLGGDE